VDTCDQIVAGNREIIIAVSGAPYARLVPYEAPKKYILGTDRSLIIKIAPILTLPTRASQRLNATRLLFLHNSIVQSFQTIASN
jgi:antitoxin (DNA-binding transcriptional repressor) of toxin-antitoxin stability system